MYSVILVDDEVRTVDALEKNVDWKKCGIRRVFKASGMQKAVQLLTDEKIEILVCDIEMPNGSGIQILEWVREHGKKVNCIFVTCHPEFAYMRRAIQLNCYDYILKPIDYEEFSRILSGLVQKMEQLEAQGLEATALEPAEISRQVVTEEPRPGSERNVELEVKQYIRSHMVDNITVTDIARELHFNPQYLMRVFKGKTGVSIVEYMTAERMKMAKKILETTDLPIKIVASMVGYEDYAYFTRVFKKEEGESPVKYRSSRR